MIRKVNLAKIEGEGDFSCPKCGVKISPEDETENVYTIQESIIGEDDYLKELIIRCNKCNSTISVEGFDALFEEENQRIEISKELPDSKPGFRTCHDVMIDGQYLGTLVVEYAQKEDVKAFKRLRKLHVGDAFKCLITVSERDTELKEEDILVMAKVLRRKFKGLKAKDTYVTEIREGSKKLLGKY